MESNILKIKARIDEKALDETQAIFPQCAKCLYHFKSQQLLKKHMCTGTRESWGALSVAMRHADHLLARMDFSITGAIDQTASMFLDDGDTPPYATFEPNFFAGWTHTKKNMHPELILKHCCAANEFHICLLANIDVPNLRKLF